MGAPMIPDVRIFPDLEAVSRAEAESVAQLIGQLSREQGRVVLALSGGSTPSLLYRLLAERDPRSMAWSQLHLCWSDERYVEPHDKSSNFRMARESLLEFINIPKENIHPMPTSYADPAEAARAYENELRSLFPGTWPRFDLVLLGMGEDGHTASLFPDSAALEEQQHWVLATISPAEPKQRLSLTLPVLNNASAVYFLVSGSGKASALAAVLSGDPAYQALPAARVKPKSGKIVWWVDQAATRASTPLHS